MYSSAILEYFGIYRRTEKPSYDKRFLHLANDVFKRALSGASWFLYVTAVLLVASCLYYYYFEKRARRLHGTRVREIQQLFNRPTPKRRPGAVTREREVYRNVLKNVHAFVYPEKDKKSCLLRQTRSGKVYARFIDGEDGVRK